MIEITWPTLCFVPLEKGSDSKLGFNVILGNELSGSWLNVSQGTKRETDDTHSHFSAEVNGCCATQTAKEMRVRTSDVRWHVISAAWPRPPHHHRECLQVDDAVAIHIYVRRFTLVLLPSVLGILRFTVVALGFSPCDGISLFPPWGRKPRTSYTSPVETTRDPRAYERASICSEVCKLPVYELQAEKFSRHRFMAQIIF